MFFNNIELQEGEYVLPGVKVIDNAIDNPDKLIEIANAIPDAWGASTVGSEYGINSDVRRSNSFPFNVHFDNPLEFFQTAQKIFLYAQIYSQENSIPFSHMETISMLEYLSGDGFYLPHMDFGPDLPRQISAIMYLNDVEEGGETYFDRFDLSIQPRAGRLVLFPSTFPYTHEARTPSSGNKYILVTWFGMPLDLDGVGKYYR